MTPRRSIPAIIALVPTQGSQRAPIRVDTLDDGWFVLEEFSRQLRRLQGHPGWQLS